MNPYRAFIDAQERNCMTDDEKLEKRNLEIIMSYRNAGANTYKREIVEDLTTKSESVNNKPGKTKEKNKYRY